MNKYVIYTIIGSIFLVAAAALYLHVFVIDKQTELTKDPSTEENGNKGDAELDKDKDKDKNKDKDKDKNKEKEKDKDKDKDKDKKDKDKDKKDKDKDKKDKKKIYWGVDSASKTNEELFKCVANNFGQPKVWGRYLGDREDVSVGLDTDEVKYLHSKDVRVLVIYNHFNDATGYDHGVDEAKKAIDFAKELEVPEGVALFGDIEPGYPVDTAFIDGWYETLSGSVYETGLYGVFDKESALMKAYNATDNNVQKDIVVWTAFPQEEITTKENAPAYNPKGPEKALLYGWQYAIEAEQCTIDTNLFSEKILDYLW